MAANVTGVRTMSEPFSWVHAHGMYVRREIAHAQYVRLLRGCVRLQCKRERSRQGDTHLVIKTNCLSAPTFPLFRKMFPKFTLIYNTRNFQPTLKSLMKMTLNLPR